MQYLKKGKLRQSATQNWLLFINLPLMMGEKVNRNHDVWLCYTTLLELCRIVFQEEISEVELLILGSHIDEFLTEFKRIFTERKITPKMHHLVHYPRYIRMFGPLLNVWAMRFEGKHAYFKKVQKMLNNFINPPFSLALRHQQWLTKQMTISNTLLRFEISCSNSSPCSLKSISYGLQVADFFSLDTEQQITERLNWYKLNSLTFKVHESVILCPLGGVVAAGFGLLVDIFSFKSRVIFVCKMLRTLKFDSHFQTFVVSAREDREPSPYNKPCYLAVSPSALASYQIFALHTPCHCRPVNDIFHISTKSEISKLVLRQPF